MSYTFVVDSKIKEVTRRVQFLGLSVNFQISFPCANKLIIYKFSSSSKISKKFLTSYGTGKHEAPTYIASYGASLE